MLLTQSTTPIIGWIAKLLGFVMQGIFSFLDGFGIQNIGLCIIIFTIIVRLLMLPLTIRQQKFSRISQAMQPEISKIQKKYRNRKDQASIQRQNEEIKEVYEKYGTSPSGGCLQMLIQLPVFLSLYQVIRKIPAYIPQVKAEYIKIVDAIGLNSDSIAKINKIAEGFKSSYVKMLEPNATSDQVIDVLNYFNVDSWAKMAKAFPSAADVIHKVSATIIDMNNFIFGINVSEIPGFRFSVYLIIPILAALFQYLSAKTMQTPQDGAAAGMTKSMTMMMPLMSLYFCIIMPAGLGIYWVTSAAFQCLQQVILNRYFDNQDLDKLVEKNREKAAKKKKKGKKSLMNKAMDFVGQNKSSENAPSDAYSSTGTGYYTVSQKAGIQTKKLVPPAVDGTDYYQKLEKTDTTKAGAISRRAYAVLQYDKEHQAQTKGGK